MQDGPLIRSRSSFQPSRPGEEHGPGEEIGEDPEQLGVRVRGVLRVARRPASQRGPDMRVIRSSLAARPCPAGAATPAWGRVSRPPPGRRPPIRRTGSPCWPTSSAAASTPPRRSSTRSPTPPWSQPCSSCRTPPVREGPEPGGGALPARRPAVRPGRGRGEHRPRAGTVTGARHQPRRASSARAPGGSFRSAPHRCAAPRVGALRPGSCLLCLDARPGRAHWPRAWSGQLEPLLVASARRRDGCRAASTGRRRSEGTHAGRRLRPGCRPVRCRCRGGHAGAGPGRGRARYGACPVGAGPVP
ncbi:hypothetical protein BX265_0179 [Streptomyces sp. TLI_235]|nr:hypothetical protein BX265_0179 [Streptomyces sp. TLI_235]